MYSFLSLFGFVWVLGGFTACARGGKVTQKQLELSWLFSWDSQLALPNPITAQCETLHVAWGRDSMTGPDPIAPYSMLVFSSNEQSPLVIDAGSALEFDLTIPFGPSTQYQVCMFDSRGNTGGCQAVYTVYPTIDQSTGLAPTCTNVTFPKPLNVTMTQGDGTELSRYAFNPPQCDTLTVTPNEGTPPFTLTIAPALRPPINITSETSGPINWTVDLDWATPFFLLLADADGRTYTAGPLHAGGPGTTKCFARGPSGPSNGGKIAGAVIGSLVAGVLLGVTSMTALSVYRSHRAMPKPSLFSSFEKKEFSVLEEGQRPVVPLNIDIAHIPSAPSSIVPAMPRASSLSAPLPAAPLPAEQARHNSTSPRRSRKNTQDMAPAGTLRTENSVGESSGSAASSPEFVSPSSTSAISGLSSVSTITESPSEAQGPLLAGRVYIRHMDGGTVIELPPSYVDGRPQPPPSTQS
ncbi:hypothetical protein PUNSTDRAFT_136346 [Punctularia strigosozonata HHB-11173 SS5]|uniref:uncharacterized protein n=1 Tax=Punctularia strigosozonata (strain HHB-11173) TaxID=741275 RepID=UPI000441730E|nr:uncharacterized protein PUNSTDRAFT_136346 [Punctularia strigosozonata HHB-11173 SS5]EIN06488.1 hypothetical protein PUNSTDRAFT_136346 [Punctularia strigosozonata HHB-11173 SS5]